MNDLAVLIPTLNIDSTLLNCVVSVLGDQSVDARNIYVVFDNGDLNLHILEDIKNLGVNIVTNSSKGVAAALNAGLIQINNTYIRRMDSDDCWINLTNRDEVEKLLKLNYWVCGRPINLHGKDKKKISLVPELPKGLISKYSFLPGNPICHPTMYFSKNSITVAGGYSENSVAEDFNLWLKLLLMGDKIFYIPENFVYYRRSDLQTSKQLRSKQVSDEEFRLWHSLIGSEFGATKDFLDFAVCRKIGCTHTKCDLEKYKNVVYSIIRRLLILDKSQIDKETILNVISRFHISIFRHVSIAGRGIHLIEILVRHPIVCIRILSKTSLIYVQNLILKFRGARLGGPGQAVHHSGVNR